MIRFSLIVATGAALVACEQSSSAPAGEANEAVASNTASRTNGTSAAAAGSEKPLAMAASDPALKWGPCPDIFPAGCQIAVLHGDPAGPNADVLLRVQPSAYLPPHRHTSAERMILVGGRFQVNFQGSEPITLMAGDYAYGPANLAHDARCLGPGPCTLFIAFETPVDAVAVEGAIN